jgi:maltose O-acetyltransferase
MLGMRGLARTADVSANCFFGSADVAIGERSYLNQRVYIEASARVEIGEDVAIGPDVMLVTSTHRLGDSQRRWGALEAQPIVIGDGCWLGARVTVLPGVTIGHGCIIAAGAVVASDCGSDGLYGGTPARLKRDLGRPGGNQPIDGDLTRCRQGDGGQTE